MVVNRFGVYLANLDLTVDSELQIGSHFSVAETFFILTIEGQNNPRL